MSGEHDDCVYCDGEDDPDWPFGAWERYIEMNWRRLWGCTFRRGRMHLFALSEKEARRAHPDQARRSDMRRQYRRKKRGWK